MNRSAAFRFACAFVVCVVLLFASGISTAIIPNNVAPASKRGNSNVFQLAANTSAATAGTPFCDDGSGNATTVGCTGGGGGTGSSAVANVTPVTVSANTTADQTLQEVSLSAGFLNILAQPFLIHGSGIFTIAALQTPTLTFKAKLCTVSGCGSGTVVTLASIATTATVAATNNPWNMNLKAATSTTGASGALWVHGPLAIDIGATSSVADSVFNDTNTAPSGTINLAAGLFIDFTVATSAGNAGNSFTQQILTAEPASTIGPAGPTGPAGGLSGLTTNAVVVATGSTAAGTPCTTCTLSAGGTLAVPGPINVGTPGTLSGAWSPVGKTSGNSVKVTVSDTTAAATVTIPGTTGPALVYSGTPVNGQCPVNSGTDGTVVSTPCSGGGGSGIGATVPYTGWTLVNSVKLSNFPSSPGVSTYVTDAGSLNWRLATRPLTIPYTLTATMQCAMGNPAVTSQDCGLYISDGTKLMGFEMLSQTLANGANQLRVEEMNSVTSDNSTPAGPTAGLVANQFWTVQISNDGTHRTFSYYTNGGFVQFLQQASGTFLTETVVGFGGLSVVNSGTDAVVNTLLYWNGIP